MALNSSGKNTVLEPHSLNLKTVGIIGAGPAGLAIATALRNQGIEVHIYDQAKAFRPIGAGLTLSPNGLRSLQAIAPNIVPQLKQRGSEIRRFRIRSSKRGWPLILQRMSGNEYDQPFISIRWFDLQTILKSQLPPENFHLTHRLTWFEQSQQHVTLFFENNETATVDLLIGADGIHSAVRQQLFDIGTPGYGGWMTWRGVLTYQHRLIPPHQATVFGQGGQIFLVMDNGNGKISWSLEMMSDSDTRSRDSSDVKARVAHTLATWYPLVRDIVDRTDAEIIVERPVCTPLMLKQWSKHRVTLLGDAAHAMGPALGQGTNTTFEDAWALSSSLSNAVSLDKALAQYEASRIERTMIVQYRTLLSAARMQKPFINPRKFMDALGSVPEQAKISDKEFSHWLYQYNFAA